MIVYVLFHETNSGRYETSDGFVEGVYAMEEDAERERVALLRKLRDDGEQIYLDPDLGDDQKENDAWEHDVRVECHQLIEGQPEEPDDACTNPGGHVWNRTVGEADEARLSGDYANDNIRCVFCGADGDA